MIGRSRGRPRRAVLFFSAADGSSSTSMTMAREGGAWKLGGE